MLDVSVVGWSHHLVLRGEVLASVVLGGVVPPVVEGGENSVVGGLVVVAGWLEVVQVGERGGVVWSQVLDLV